MERNFSMLDTDALELISEIRISKDTYSPISLRHNPVFCPVCGKEAGLLGEAAKAFCWECLREFNIRTGKLDKLDNKARAKCISCGKPKVLRSLAKNGECDTCRTRKRYYTSCGTCAVCGKEARFIHKDKGVCFTCDRKTRKRVTAINE